MTKSRTFVKKVSEMIIGKKDSAEIKTGLAKANSQLAKGVKHGLVSKKKMARTMSKLAKRASAK